MYILCVLAEEIKKKVCGGCEWMRERLKSLYGTPGAASNLRRLIGRGNGESVAGSNGL
jgi:hypothetical protein